MRAANSGRLDMVRLLAKRGADVNASDSFGYSVLGLAVLGNHVDVMKLLLKLGASPDGDKNGQPPLALAADTPNVCALRVLIAAHADVNGHYSNRDQDTALRLVVRRHSLPCVIALVAAGADPKRPNRKGETALSLAKKEKLPKILKALHAK